LIENPPASAKVRIAKLARNLLFITNPLLTEDFST